MSCCRWWHFFVVVDVAVATAVVVVVDDADYYCVAGAAADIEVVPVEDAAGSLLSLGGPLPSQSHTLCCPQ